jgi:glycosyltransferase involved in cell wall biosynthesis
MDISIVVPLLNEEGSLPELEAWIRKVMTEHNFSYEVLMIDDGSTDTSWRVIEGLHQSNPSIKGIKFRRNYGKSAALNVGFEHAKGDVVITMDADLQDSPDEAPDLYKMIMTDGYDLVSGWKKERHDPLSKTIPSKFFNAATRKMSGIELNDFNCGLKAYKNEVVKNIEVYGEMHRYIPLIAKWEGFKNIGEKVVQHQARIYGETKFGGWERGVKGLLDLLSITFVGKFGKRPMHLFGTLGAILFFLGTIILMVLSYNKLFLDEYNIADRPLFFLGILFFIIGTQLFLAGFLAEMIARVNPRRNNYQVETVLEK